MKNDAYGCAIKTPYNKIEILIDGKPVFIGTVSHMTVCPGHADVSRIAERPSGVYNGEGKISIDFVSDYELSIANLPINSQSST